MKRAVLAALLVACVAACRAGTTIAPGLPGSAPIARDVASAPRARIDDVAWLAGEWAAVDGDTRAEERWSAPAGGTMVATGITARAGRPAFFEFLRIGEHQGTLVYFASPRAAPPTPFVLARIGPREVVFQNLAHDFPKRVIYRRTSETELVARVEDDSRGEDFRWTRR